METDPFVELQDAIAGNADPGAQFAVPGVGIGHERVQPVIAPLQLDQ